MKLHQLHSPGLYIEGSEIQLTQAIKSPQNEICHLGSIDKPSRKDEILSGFSLAHSRIQFLCGLPIDLHLLAIVMGLLNLGFNLRNPPGKVWWWSKPVAPGTLDIHNS